MDPDASRVLPQLRGICVPMRLDGMRTGRFDKGIALACRSHDHELAVLLAWELAAVNRKPLATLSCLNSTVINSPAGFANAVAEASPSGNRPWIDGRDVFERKVRQSQYGPWAHVTQSISVLSPEGRARTALARWGRCGRPEVAASAGGRCCWPRLAPSRWWLPGVSSRWSWGTSFPLLVGGSARTARAAIDHGRLACACGCIPEVCRSQRLVPKACPPCVSER